MVKTNMHTVEGVKKQEEKDEREEEETETFFLQVQPCGVFEMWNLW